ncbi:RusA family crossover junction endodeoxyribonuclease [Faecalibaculum rodentium]|uniref:RusA family crossover junction endodeoxyribonuclease n=1 Tax=Faecalibaculum rodentium TaxID=1702221 RepID=UPI00272C6748|nr:RusA family crossover junction endodeoxyribonuclease [Faecalibaculum rodentium]
MNEIYIVIPGEPYRKTHQSGTHIGQGRTYKDAGLREVESRLMEALKPNAPSAPWNGPIQLAVNFGYETRNVLKDREPKITKPDTDNLMKTLKDCMTACGFWWDDAQVAEEFASKFWTIQPHITIVVSKMEQ